MPEGDYIAKALGASIITQAESTDELHILVWDAVHCHFDEGKRPTLIRLHFIQLLEFIRRASAAMHNAPISSA